MQSVLRLLRFFLLFFPCWLTAQEKTSDVPQLRYEIFAQTGFNRFEKRTQVVVFNGTGADTTNYLYKFAPVYRVGYRYHFFNWFSLGTALGYQQKKTYKVLPAENKFLFNTKSYQVQISLQAYWLRRKYIRLYSALNQDIAFEMEKGPNISTASFELGTHLVPLGIRLGNRLGFMAEYQWGVDPLYQAGFFWRMTNDK